VASSDAESAWSDDKSSLGRSSVVDLDSFAPSIASLKDAVKSDDVDNFKKDTSTYLDGPVFQVPVDAYPELNTDLTGETMEALAQLDDDDGPDYAAPATTPVHHAQSAAGKAGKKRRKDRKDNAAQEPDAQGQQFRHATFRGLSLSDNNPGTSFL